MSYRSSGTVLYPLFRGHYQLPPSRWSLPTLAERLQFIWDNIAYSHPVRSLPLFVVAALLVPWRATHGALAALSAASVAGFLAIAWGFPNSNVVAMSRYYYGFMVATMLAGVMYACAYDWRAWRSAPVRMRVAGCMLACAVLLQLTILADTVQSYRELVAAWFRPPAFHFRLVDEQPRYRDMQSAIPAGAPVLVMLDQAFWLDYGRNKIDLIDLPGEVSPPPGMPLDDDEALAAYLQANGYRYVALVRPDKSSLPFRRAIWEALAGPYPTREWINVAPTYVRVLDRFDGLIASRAPLYDDGAFVVLDLATRALW